MNADKGVEPLGQLWADLEAESRKPGPTMTITKAQYAALLDSRVPASPDGLREALVQALRAEDHTESCIQAHYGDGGQAGCICGIDNDRAPTCAHCGHFASVHTGRHDECECPCIRFLTPEEAAE